VPELPELEVMREVLSDQVAGREIAGVRVLHPEILKTVEPAVVQLVGQAFRCVSRRGKHLVLTCSDELHLVIHLMLAGRLVLSRDEAKATKATAFLVSFADGGDLRVIENTKVRRAGVFVVKDPADVRRVAEQGVEPLCEAFTPEWLAATAAGVRRQLKKLLTDQRTIAGIGSAYADEIAFVAGLSPLRYVSTLSADEVSRLHGSVREVLHEAIEAIRVQSNGAQIADHDRGFVRVYNRAGQPCVRCGTPIAEIRYAEKRTYYCPNCQTSGKILRDRRSWLTR